MMHNIFIIAQASNSIGINWNIIGAWVAVGLTLFIFSFLYKDNPLYKLGEHIYVGVTIGYTVVLAVFQSLKLMVWEPFKKLWVENKLFDIEMIKIVVPVILGILLLTRFIPKIGWISRWAFAYIIGFGAGLVIPRAIHSLILKQTQSTVQPIIAKTPEGVIDIYPKTIVSDISNLILIVGVLTVLIYFFFSIEHKGSIKTAAKVGIVFLMVYFGASYGATAMGRLSLLYGRFYDLYSYSTKDFFYATPIILGIMLVVLLIYHFKKEKKKTPEH